MKSLKTTKFFMSDEGASKKQIIGTTQGLKRQKLTLAQAQAYLMEY